MNNLDAQLRELQSLRDAGLLDQATFDAQHARLVEQSTAPPADAPPTAPQGAAAPTVAADLNAPARRRTHRRSPPAWALGVAVGLVVAAGVLVGLQTTGTVDLLGHSAQPAAAEAATPLPEPAPTPPASPSPTATPAPMTEPAADATPSPTEAEAQSTEVPDVAGMTSSNASTVLADAGFVVATAELENADVDAGTVLQTDPAAGTAVEDGETVTVFVATAPPGPSDGSVAAREQAPGCPFVVDGPLFPTFPTFTPESQAVVSPLVRFASALNADDPTCAWTVYTDAYKGTWSGSLDRWAADHATSDVIAYDVVSVQRTGDSSAVVATEWRSTQSGAPELSREPGETCTVWPLTYEVLRGSDGIWRLNQVLSGGSNARAC